MLKMVKNMITTRWSPDQHTDAAINRFNLGLLILIRPHILGAEIVKCRNLLKDTTFIPIITPIFRKTPPVILWSNHTKRCSCSPTVMQRRFKVQRAFEQTVKSVTHTHTHTKIIIINAPFMLISSKQSLSSICLENYTFVEFTGSGRDIRRSRNVSLVGSSQEAGNTLERGL